MTAYKLQLKIIVMPLITMIIMISAAVLGGPGPGTRPARNKWFSSERDSGYCGVGVGVAERRCMESASQEDRGLSGSADPAPLRFWPQIPGNFVKRVKSY